MCINPNESGRYTRCVLTPTSLVGTLGVYQAQREVHGYNRGYGTTLKNIQRAQHQVIHSEDGMAAGLHSSPSIGSRKFRGTIPDSPFEFLPTYQNMIYEVETERERFALKKIHGLSMLAKEQNMG